MITLLGIVALVFAADPSVSIQPSKIKEGQVTLVTVAHDGPMEFKLRCGNLEIPHWSCAPDKECAFLPIALKSDFGDRDLVLSAGEKEIRVRFTVEQGKFTSTILKVEPDRVHPTPEQQARIDKEMKEVEDILKTTNARPLWNAPFQRPEKGGVTSSFGNRRVYNGDLKRQHEGLDLRAAMMTPIHVSNDGTVVLAKELFNGGNMVLVDHGVGVFSSYAHLSEIKVNVGQKVVRGDIVGLSGATGRVTGPHLHWGMRVSGVPVDPIQFMKLTSEQNRVICGEK